MPTYHTVELEDYRDVFICDDCGAMVLNETQHDIYHSHLDSVAATASAADQTAGLFRPIG